MIATFSLGWVIAQVRPNKAPSMPKPIIWVENWEKSRAGPQSAWPPTYDLEARTASLTRISHIWWDPFLGPDGNAGLAPLVSCRHVAKKWNCMLKPFLAISTSHSRLWEVITLVCRGKPGKQAIPFATSKSAEEQQLKKLKEPYQLSSNTTIVHVYTALLRLQITP